MPISPHAKILHAISFAARHHRHQLRKDDRTPYIAHPVRVMTILALEFGVTDPEVLAAGILHDTIEDTNADCDEVIEHFGRRVASLVADLTKDKRLPENEREAAYFAQLERAPIEAKLIKLADTIDNLIDSSTMSAGKPAPKALNKAKHVVDCFTPFITSDWSHSLEKLRQQIAVTEQHLGDASP